jgi:signal transduction histidine kinase
MNARQTGVVDSFATRSSLLEKQQMRTTLALTSDSTLCPADQLSTTAGVAASNSNRVLTNELRYVSATDLTEGRDNSLRKPLNILVVDDDDGDRAQLKRVLKQTGLPSTCTETSSINDALEACENAAFDCAIVDYRLPGEDGLAGVALLHDRYPYMALIMVTGQGDEAIATEAMRSGASDYIRKTQISVESIARSIENAVERAALLRKVARQREEMEVFGQVLVHDLKGPIQNLLAYVDFIEQSIQGGKAEEAVAYCVALVRATTRMNSLIDTLHQYTTAEAQVAFEPLEMRQVIIDTLGNLEHVIKERGARVTYGELPAVSGTPQLTQLMQNLIGNSIKYCEAETPLVHISAKLQGDNVWLFLVEDNGIGIPEKYAQQVFEPFHRLHGVGKYEGTGLGLATCRKIVERHGGTISCASKEGQGTTFRFTLRGVN